jgi:hypothetical protein
MPAMSGSQWDAAQWGSLVLAPGEPDSDTIDRRRTVPELAEIVSEPVDYIKELIASGRLAHLNKGDVTVSLREWNEATR